MSSFRHVLVFFLVTKHFRFEQLSVKLPLSLCWGGRLCCFHTCGRVCLLLMLTFLNGSLLFFIITAPGINEWEGQLVFFFFFFFFVFCSREPAEVSSPRLKRELLDSCIFSVLSIFSRLNPVLM